MPDSRRTDDEPATGDETTDTATTSADGEGLGDAGKRALDNERQARKEAERVARAEAAARRAAEAKIAAYEDAQKTAEERQAEQLAGAQATAADATAKLLRLEVALDKGVPRDLIEFLTGSTREEVEAKASTLMKHFKSVRGTEDDGGEPGSLDGGARPPAPTPNLTEQIAAAQAKGDWSTLNQLNAQLLAEVAEQ